MKCLIQRRCPLPTRKIAIASLLGQGTEDPLQSIEFIMAFSSKDWGVDPKDAWIYGIVCGWGGAIEEIAARHDWSPEAVERLKRLHEKFEALRKP